MRIPARVMEIDGHEHDGLMTARDRDDVLSQLQRASFRRTLACYETARPGMGELRVWWGNVAVWRLVSARLRSFGPVQSNS